MCTEIFLYRPYQATAKAINQLDFGNNNDEKQSFRNDHIKKKHTTTVGVFFEVRWENAFLEEARYLSKIHYW